MSVNNKEIVNENIKLIIREMEREDIDQLIDIEKKCFTTPWSRQAFEDELNRTWGKIFILEYLPHKDIVGYTDVWLVYDELHILNFAISPGYCNKGYGSKLMSFILRYSLKKGLKYGTLEVRRSNSRAINLYKKFGFKIVGMRPKYYQDNDEDALIMSIDIKIHKDKIDAR